jgi:hypothetical protein
MKFNDWVGTIGVGLILLGYFASTFNFISGKSKMFFLLNTLGAGLASYTSYLIGYWPFVILEGTWMLVSLIGLIKTLTGSGRFGRPD